MTREEQAIEYIKKYRELDEKLCNSVPKGTIASIAAEKCLEFWDMAIQALSSWEEYSDKLWKKAYERGKTEALSQEPCETIHGSTYGGVSWGGVYKPQEPCDDATLKDIFCMGCEYKEQEPCTDTVSIRKDILKCRVGKIVAYNVEWLREHWQMEMDIVCGVKPCDDAISRQAVLDLLEDTNNGWIINEVVQLPSVTQKSGKWITDEPTVFKPYICSECGIFHNGKYKNYCPNCGCRMVEPQESEE